MTMRRAGPWPSSTCCSTRRLASKVEPQWKHRYERDGQLLKQAQQFTVYMHGRRWSEKHEKAVEAYLKRNS